MNENFALLKHSAIKDTFSACYLNRMVRAKLAKVCESVC